MTDQLPRGTAQSVTIAYLEEQRTAGWPDVHPEDYCHRCGNRNISWWIDSPIWNAVMDSPFSPHHGIICPACFGILFEERFPDTSFELRLSTDTRGARAFLTQHPEAQRIDYIGAGGRPAHVIADFDLGAGRFRPTQEHGPRRALWDAAHGYVSGFRKRDIAYYLLTRSLSPRLNRLAIRHETRGTDRRTCPHYQHGTIGRTPICFHCGTTNPNDLPTPDHEPTALAASTEPGIEQLIERSSFGTDSARAARARVSDETAARLVRGSKALSMNLGQIRLLVHDLDIARADGTVLTYGYIQHRLRQVLEESGQPL